MAIEAWFHQFTQLEQAIAAKLLDAVQFVSIHESRRAYVDLLPRLQGWDPRPTVRTGRWWFLAFGRPGESGGTMLRELRIAAALEPPVFHNMFPEIRDLVDQSPSAGDTIVLVDDFSGTGRQACATWAKLSEVLAPYTQPRSTLDPATATTTTKPGCSVHLLLVGARQRGIETIRAAGLRAEAFRLLDDHDDVFHPSSPTFDEGERKSLLKMCMRADKKNPTGFGQCGLAFVIAHRTPNNSLPILHVRTNKFVGLFPRR